ncbi:winged helix-turn-helix domain-containing protein [Streptomyces kunmingensis]|uniref:Winged helix-turn-helix domain-containing protein n=1 Tax=Streptomyces kunmingensis TaxID=68225 RepID=A0ABU6CJF1_9ACTN|nr:winged helix-turn-helix domain-containing protein [Streptomyces kunmingensis]MEB3964840.1 winged helix-turn-helix domain-containing protein [Streptomyces kunmingensis]
MNSPDGGVPEFFVQPLTPDLREGLDVAVRTPTRELADEIALLPRASRENPALRELAEGTDKGRRIFADNAVRYFNSCLAPIWPQLQAVAVTDRALRAESLLRGGVDALLAGLVPGWRWQPPTWHINAPCAHDIDVHLDGAGLLLIPSYFAYSPLYGHRDGEPPMLCYPVHAGEHPAGAADALGPLLGRTRSAILASLRHPATTTATADRVGISLPSASQHATVLRNAGLITTTRTGTAVLHTLTPLGEALLRSDRASG